MLNPIFFTLLIFGIWISYYDIKKGKIKNYFLLVLIITAVFINIFFTKAFIEFPLASFLNILFGIFLAVIIWIAGLWSAADAKLFMAINFLFPVTFYQHSFGYFPGISILTNSTIPLFVFLFLQIMVRTNLKEKKKALLSQLKLSFVFQLLLTITAMYSISFLISNFLKIRKEYLIWMMFLFLLFWLIEQKLKIKLTYFFVFIVIFTTIFSFVNRLLFFTSDSLFFILSIFFLIFLLYIILKLSTFLFTSSMKIDKLKEGMIPAEMIIERKGIFIKEPITFFTFLSLLRQRVKKKPIIGFNSDGLEIEEIEEIQDLYRKGLLKFDQLKISIIMPLAPILFLGALLTYFLKGPLLF